MITCREFVEFLYKYREEALSAEERSVFDAHLSVCPPCVRYLKSYDDTIKLGKEAFRDPDGPAFQEIPEDLVRAVLAARRPRGGDGGRS